MENVTSVLENSINGSFWNVIRFSKKGFLARFKIGNVRIR